VLRTNISAPYMKDRPALKRADLRKLGLLSTYFVEVCTPVTVSRLSKDLIARCCCRESFATTVDKPLGS